MIGVLFAKHFALIFVLKRQPYLIKPSSNNFCFIWAKDTFKKLMGIVFKDRVWLKTPNKNF